MRWRWTGSELLVRNDRYGLVPAYYHLGPDGFAISTSIQPLLDGGVSAELDEDALAVFLRMETFLGEDTPFKAIRALPPGTDYVWRGGNNRPWGEYVLGSTDPRLTRPQAIEQFGVLLRQAVQRRADLFDRFCVALSGGMDSRHILLDLCRIGRKPQFAFTVRSFGSGLNDDMRLAAIISVAAAVPHVTVDQPEDWLRAERRRNLETNFCSFEHDWCMPVADHLRGQASAIFDGLAGDVFTDCRSIISLERLEAFDQARFADLAREFLGPESRPLRYLAGEIRRRLTYERAVERFVAECSRVAAAPNPLAAFWFWNRTRRTVALASYGIWQRAFHVMTPFLDHAVFDFMTSLPVEMVIDYTFHRDVIWREFPEYAHIEFFSGPNGPPQSRSAGYYRMFWQTLSFTLQWSSNSLLSHGYILSRLGRMMLDHRYRQSADWLPRCAVYLKQLEDYGGRLRTESGQRRTGHDATRPMG